MPLASVIVFGLGDSLNPCNLSTLVIFAAYLGWLRHRRVSIDKLAWLFLVMSFIATFVYVCGGLMNVLYSIPFLKAMRVVYVVLGVVFVVVGILHLIDWRRIYSENEKKLALPLIDNGQGKPIAGVLAGFGVIVLACVLNACATVWPSNKFVMFYANYLSVPGQTQNTLIMLVVYSVMLTLPLALGLWWIQLTSPDGWVARNMSRAKVMLSAFVLGLGVSLICIFR